MFILEFRKKKKKVKFSVIVGREPLFIGVVTTEFKKQYVLVCAASLRPHEGYNPK